VRGSGGGFEYDSYLQSRPDEAEMEAIQLMIRLCRAYSCRVHIVHLSSAKALPVLAEARAEGLPITIETCPHYLYFAAEAIPAHATQFKCAPPIRDAANRESLWNALGSGLIDMVASDHSPCPPELKKLEKGDFFEAWGGIASLSLVLPILWTAARQRGFEITDVVRWTCEKTADLAGLGRSKGRIAAGFDADFAVFDPDARFEVTPERLRFRHAVSPYVGEYLHGEVLMTFVRGKRVFQLDPGRGLSRVQ
jgi:allantoinase